MSASDWSLPETEVMAGVSDLLHADRRAVLATVIAVEGNAYRRPGAKMVVAEDGAGVGAITAGCLEDDVLALASQVLDADEPRVERFDLMEDDDDVWGLGVGCNGIIDILLEPLDDRMAPAVAAYEEGADIGVVTVIDGEGEGLAAGAKGFYDPDDGVTGDLPAWLAAAVADAAAELTARGKADTLTVETDAGSARVLIDGLRAAPELVVFGTGHDVAPVVELAANVGFRVSVLGFRGAAADPEKFPAADAVRSTSPAQVREAHDFDESTYAMCMTHNFVDDRLTVDELARTDVPYIGLMGPRERFEEMREDFAEEGRTFSEAELERVYTPAGLDLGAGSPYGIAHSIVAEVLAVHNDREPRHLREREGPIHERIDLEADAPTPQDD